MFGTSPIVFSEQMEYYSTTSTVSVSQNDKKDHPTTNHMSPSQNTFITSPSAQEFILNRPTTNTLLNLNKVNKPPINKQKNTKNEKNQEEEKPKTEKQRSRNKQPIEFRISHQAKGRNIQKYYSSLPTQKNNPIQKKDTQKLEDSNSKTEKETSLTNSQIIPRTDSSFRKLMTSSSGGLSPSKERRVSKSDSLDRKVRASGSKKCTQLRGNTTEIIIEETPEGERQVNITPNKFEKTTRPLSYQRASTIIRKNGPTKIMSRTFSTVLTPVQRSTSKANAFTSERAVVRRDTSREGHRFTPFEMSRTLKKKPTLVMINARIQMENIDRKNSLKKKPTIKDNLKYFMMEKEYEIDRVLYTNNDSTINKFYKTNIQFSNLPANKFDTSPLYD